MDVLTIVVSLLVGIGSGSVAAYINRPAATAAAEEAKLRTERRAQLVDDGRALVQEAYASDWEHQTVAMDLRFLALRQDLSDDVKQQYAIEHDRNTVYMTMPGTIWSHEKLTEDIERLHRDWKLS